MEGGLVGAVLLGDLVLGPEVILPADPGLDLGDEVFQLLLQM